MDWCRDHLNIDVYISYYSFNLYNSIVDSGSEMLPSVFQRMTFMLDESHPSSNLCDCEAKANAQAQNKSL